MLQTEQPLRRPDLVSVLCVTDSSTVFKWLVNSFRKVIMVLIVTNKITNKTTQKAILDDKRNY